MLTIEQEFATLNKEYLDNAIELINKFLKSKAKFWKQVPLMYHIREGKLGYSSWEYLLRDRVYNIKSTTYDSCYVHCDKCILYEYNHFNNTYHRKSRLIGLISTLLDGNMIEIDGEKIYNHLLEEIKRIEFHPADADNHKDEEWIIRAIKYSLPIKYEHYNMHFDNQYHKTEKEFNLYYQELLTKYAKHKLKTPYLEYGDKPDV
jgi:hypothetical protein